METLVYVLLAVVMINVISLTAQVVIFKKIAGKKSIVALSGMGVGVLAGFLLFHQLPTVVAFQNRPATLGLVFAGMAALLLTERVLARFVHPNHTERAHEAHVGLLNLAGAALHNATDGMLIALAFLGGPLLGVAVTIAVLLHLVPHDYCVVSSLVWEGYSPKKAVCMKAVESTVMLIGALAIVVLENYSVVATLLLPIGVGGLVVVLWRFATEVHARALPFQKKTVWQSASIGALTMACLVLISHVFHIH